MYPPPMLNPNDTRSFLLIAIVLIAAASDARALKIPNILVLLAGLSGLAFNFWYGGPPSLAMAVLGSLTGFALLIPLYAIGGMTAGDVKWLAALGAWYGPRGILSIFILSGLILGAIAMGLLLFNKIRNPNTVPDTPLKSNVDDLFESPERRLKLIPYAIPVALGVCIAEIWRLTH